MLKYRKMKFNCRYSKNKSKMAYEGPAYRAPADKDGKPQAKFNLVTLPGTQWVTYGTEKDGSPKLLLVDKMSGKPMEPVAIAKLMKIMGSETEVDKCKIRLIMTQADITDLIIKVKKECKEKYEELLKTTTEEDAKRQIDKICKAEWDEKIQPLINKTLDMERELRKLVEESKLPKDNPSIVDARHVLGEDVDPKEEPEFDTPEN